MKSRRPVNSDVGRRTFWSDNRLPVMTSESQTRKKPIWLLLFIPPLLFTLKDLIATLIVLSYEPGITAAAVYNYSVQLLPGSLFVRNGNAPALNLAFGVIIGAVLYLGARYRRHRRC